MATEDVLDLKAPRLPQPVDRMAKGMTGAVEPDDGWHTWRPEPGWLYLALPESTYHRSPGVSKSGLDLIGVRKSNRGGSPMHYQWEQEHPGEPTEAMSVGSALDCLLFEPKEFDKRFIVDDTGLHRNSNAWKKEWVPNVAKGREILRVPQWDNIRRMQDACLNHEVIDMLLADGWAQPSAYWVDATDRGDYYGEEAPKPTYRLCRGRMDWVCLGHSVAVDLKKTQDATYTKLQRTVADYRYHTQAAFYLEGLRCTGHPVDFFIFLFVEEQPPHGINLVELDRPWIQLGTRLWQRDIETYSQCIESGEWPSYPPGPRVLEMPAWAERVPTA
ncbi:MAG: PD-(D/E)XK nuclease-like domain-containing protein [Gammaproteobacteria bacterium]|nr:PD-(D/E)XK nuclease-like domain-containing protein [Gammaproteobacteria bacterium]